jgi:Lipocalin-like domain
VKSHRRAVVAVSILVLTLTAAGCSSSSSSSTEAAAAETTAAMAAETTAAMAAETTAAMPEETQVAAGEEGEAMAGGEVAPADVPALLTGKGGTWMLVSRAQDGKPAAGVECAVDDLLVFRADGTFDSKINGTPCNPSEVEVEGGSYTVATDGKVITFTVPGFSYTGTMLVATPGRIVIKFDLGQGTVIDDEFILRA